MKRKLMKLSKWRNSNFTEGAAPSINTIKRWIRDDVIDGEIIAGLYFVYEHQSQPGKPSIDEWIAHYVANQESNAA